MQRPVYRCLRSFVPLMALCFGPTLIPRAAFAQDPGAASSLTLLTGSINGQNVSPGNATIVVAPGAAISGSILVSITSTYPAGTNMSMGLTPTFGTPSSSFTDLGGFTSPAGGMAKVISINLTAPPSAQTYYLIAAFRGETSAADLMSCTAGPGAPNWASGDAIASWTPATIATAQSAGTVQVNYLFPAGNQATYVPATAIEIIVQPSPPSIQSLVLSPSSVTSGGTVTGTIAIGGTVPYGGPAATISSSSSAASVPATVPVALGSNSATFTVTAGTVASNQTATITASYGGASSTATLTVTPSQAPATGVQSVTLSPSSVASGGTVTGTVTLSAAAPAGGAVVSLTAGSSAATVPTTVTVAAGATSATFTVTAGTVNSSQTVMITASYGAASAGATLTVTPPGQAPAVTVTGVTLSASSVTSGGTDTGTVTLSGAAPSGGAVVSLSSGSTSAATVPVSVTVAAGATSAMFTVTAGTVNSSQTVTITASYGGSSSQVTLTVTPPIVAPPVQNGEAMQVSCAATFPFSIAYGDDVTNCKLGQAGQIALLNFQGNTGDHITIVVRSSWSAPCVGVYDPSNKEVGSDVCGSTFYGATETNSDFVLATTGQYTIRIHDAGYSNTGTFSLMLECWHPVTVASPLTLGLTSKGKTVNSETIDDWIFAGTAGEDVTVQVNSSYSAPCFTLVGPDGTGIASPCGSTFYGATQVMSEYILPSAGIYLVRVYSAGFGSSGTYSLLAQCLASCSSTTAPQAQTISFGTLSNQVLGAAPFALNATATSGLGVVFTSNTTSVCTVFGSVVTLVGTGTCSITASQPGSSSYLAATPVTQTFTVSAGSTTVSGIGYDLASTWSNSANPNGNWSINQGSVPLPFVPLWNAASSSTISSSCNQPAWAPSNNVGNFLPAFFELNACTATDPNFSTPDPNNVPQKNVQPGDVVLHTVDGSNGNPSLGVANVVFTLPASAGSGTYAISGSYWDAVLGSTSSSRPQDWSVYLNGTQIASGRLSGTVSRSQKQTFSVVENLNPGDQVQLQIAKDAASAGGFFVGINLTITETQSSATLCGYSLAPSSQVLPAGASTGVIGILTDPSCNWTVANNAPFVSLTGASSGIGPGAVPFSASANTGASSRSGTLTIAGQTATITQSGSAPLLLVTPSSLAVQWRQQGPLPTPIPLSVYTSASSLSYTAAASSTGNWLAVTPTSGSAPATLTVSVNPASLAAGTYQGTVTITAPTANPTSQTFTVTLTVVAVGLPTLSLSTKSLNYSFAQGSQQVRQQRIAVANSGGGTLSYTASTSTNSGGNWLSVMQDGLGATPLTPDLLTVNVDPTGLGVGTYVGQITIAAAGTTATIPVTVTVSAVQQTILLSQTGLTFIAVANGGIVPPQTFGVLNSGSGSMDWSVSSSTVMGGNWLSVTPTSGTTDASSLTVPLVTVSVNPGNLAPGAYSGQIQVTSKTANNSPQFVSVILNVLPAGSNPGPLVLPTGLIFTQAAGGAAAGPQTITLSNLTAVQQTFTTGKVTSDGSNWFTVTPATGTATPTQATTLTVTVNSAGLTPAIRQGVITLLFPGDGSVRTVNVLFLLANGGVSSHTRSGAEPRATSGNCTPTKLLPEVTSLGSQFTVPAGWPNTLSTQVVDDCGNPQVNGTVVASFSNGDPPLPLISLKNGNWTGTWQVNNSTVPLIAVTVNADDPTQKIAGQASVSGSLQNSANAPVVNTGGVVNNASYSPLAPLSPGALVSIFGTNLANGSSGASGIPLSTQLSGALVTIGGIAAPLLYASPGLINAMIPYGLPVNTQIQVIVRQGTAYTAPQSITLSAADPGVFTTTESGTGQGVIIRPDGQFAAPGTPAQDGDVVVIYASGLGETNPGATAGQPATSSPLLAAANPVNVTIGGQNSGVYFAGLVPGLTGLYQINATVPAGVHGNAVPVVVTVAGQPSEPVTMAVE